MKRYFSCSLRGRDWWLVFLSCMIVVLFALIPFELALMNLDSPHKNPLLTLTIAGCIVFGICFALAFVFAAVKLFKSLSPSVSLGEKNLSFISTKSGLASVFSGHFEFSGERIRFSRGAFALFSYILFALIIPLALWFVAFLSLGAKIDSLEKAPKPDPANIGAFSSIQIAVFILLFFVAIPFCCLLLRWIIEFKTGVVRVRFEGKIANACGFLALQTFLSIITLGLYWPAQAIRTWNYFANRISWKRCIPQGTEVDATDLIGRAGFDGSIKKGFFLLWTQALLCVITLGLYFPWAFARSAEYFIGDTFVETK
jgi:uncharacterized membrane protein YjgN (DUF898 family)